ncbi:MAG: SWF/SNF helicase family protein, partial [Synergistaceae bacterium]|nr:SWF/SNF helicase family protein [Synergistaceae bacterium]
MQRLVVSSTSAIRTTLERRLEALSAPQEQLTLLPLGSEDEWSDLDGQEQIDILLQTHLKAFKNERAEVRLLLEAAARCEQIGPDAKAEALLEWLYRLQSEEGDLELKTLIFTEFVPTQKMLLQFLNERGFSVVCLNGSMDMDERKLAQETFAKDARILISTQAGGEGLNLQFCHVVINYDIPWNPMRLEQRIGRVDRIGQTHVVRAVNFVFENSVEHRVQEVLEKKLAIIFAEFGIDKTGDVLDSAQAGTMFDGMYVEAILNPEKVEDSVEKVVARLHEQALDARTTASVLGTTEDLEPGEAQRLLNHPLPHWVELMTVSYLRAHGGQAERKNQSWNLIWPDGEIYENVVFTSKEAEKYPATRHLTLEEPKVRGLAMRLPRFVLGQPVPIISIPNLPQEVQGVWSLWRIAISTMDWDRRRIMPLFLADNGIIYMPTARHVWDQLLVTSTHVRSILNTEISQATFKKLKEAAEEHGKPIYEALVQEHQSRITRESEKSNYAFASRRRTIERIGLPQVRNYRLNILLQEELKYQEQLDQMSHTYPEMVPLLVIRVEGGCYE